MKLTIGFSPCPNDTFIFDALVNHKIDTRGYEFDVFLEDVETLNTWAFEKRLQITKLSYAAFFATAPHYKLLRSGSALGKGAGPLLISKSKAETTTIPSDALIALPGEHTTAHLLFSYAYPTHTNKKFMLFSNIEKAVLTSEVDYGVIIHENRFTYAQHGLHKVMDLGNYWEEKMKMPIPLGGIATLETLSPSIARDIEALIKESILYAYAQYPLLSSYVTCHAQEMEEAVMRQHIDLYVNDYSKDLGVNGIKAIETLYSTYTKMNLGAHKVESLFF